MPLLIALVSVAFIALASGLGAGVAPTKLKMYVILVLGGIAIGMEDLAFAFTNRAWINYTTNPYVNSVLTGATITAVTVIGIVVGDKVLSRIGNKK